MMRSTASLGRAGSSTNNRRTIRWTEKVDRPLPDGEFTCHRSIIGGVRRGSYNPRSFASSNRISTISDSETAPILSLILARSIARSWNTRAKESVLKPDVSLAFIAAVPGNRSAAMALLKGITRTVGRLPAYPSFWTMIAGLRPDC